MLNARAGGRAPKELPTPPENSPEYLIASQFRNELLAGTTARGRRTIENLWAVCDEMVRAGAPVTASEVGRRLEARFGGPKAQSIRDQPDRLKRLVDLCAAVGNRSKLLAAREEEGVLAEVRDQTLRARLRLILEDRDRLRTENSALRKAFERLAPVRELTADQCYGPGPASLPAQVAEVVAVQGDSAFTPEEKAAIRKFLDAEFLQGEGFRIDDKLGLLSDESGRSVLPPAFVQALRKIVGFER